jgi:hypothetical protein
MKAQPRAPLALAAIAFACGILLARHLQPSPRPWGWSAAAFAFCALAAVAVKSLRSAQVAAPLALVCAGAFAYLATPAPHIFNPPTEFLNDDRVEICLPRHQ